MPGPKPRQRPPRRPRPLGKHHHVQAAIQRLTCMRKAPLKILLPRQRKHVVKRRHQEISQRPEQHESFLARHPLRIAEMPIILQHLARHRDRHAICRIPRRQRVLNQRPVIRRDVIAQSPASALAARGAFPAYVRPGEKPHQRLRHQFNKRAPDPRTGAHQGQRG